jgi:hypothetical protein
MFFIRCSMLFSAWIRFIGVDFYMHLDNVVSLLFELARIRLPALQFLIFVPLRNAL